MQIIWKLKKAFLRDVMDELPHTKQSTVSTLIRILQEKGFLSYKAYGKSYEYYPLVGKDAYSKFYMNGFLKGYFGGSFKRMLSFFMEEKELDLQELDELLQQMKEDDND